MPVTIGGSGPITGVTSINTSVSDTELGYLDGVSSALQTQIDAKAATTALGLTKITNASVTAATSVSINNCFSGTYDRYEIVIDITASATSVIRMRVGGVDATSNDYAWQQLFADGTTAVGERVTGTSGLRTGNGNATSTNNPTRITLFNPAKAVPTQFFGLNLRNLTTPVLLTVSGVHNVSTAYDGFTLTSSNNMTGTIHVYGYGN